MLAANGRFWQLLGLFGADAPREASDVTRGRDRSIAPYMQAAEVFIANHFAAGIAASDVAAYVGFERTYFSSRFHSMTGRTLQEAIMQHRLAKARQLLAETDLTVAAVARAVGLGGGRAFSRWFRQRTGVPPGAWRDRQRAEG